MDACSMDWVCIIKLVYERDFIHKKAGMQNNPEMWENYRVLAMLLAWLNQLESKTNILKNVLQNKWMNKKTWKAITRIAGNRKNVLGLENLNLENVY